MLDLCQALLRIPYPSCPEPKGFRTEVLNLLAESYRETLRLFEIF
jgi:hypothetical protein